MNRVKYNIDLPNWTCWKASLFWHRILSMLYNCTWCFWIWMRRISVYHISCIYLYHLYSRYKYSIAYVFNSLSYAGDIGGALGLFFGASLLSFIETVDFWFTREGGFFGAPKKRNNSMTKNKIDIQPEIISVSWVC